MKVYLILILILLAFGNFNAQIKINPTSDCNKAIVLCHKKPLTILYTNGIGEDKS
jgi:hypothetical protein